MKGSAWRSAAQYARETLSWEESPSDAAGKKKLPNCERLEPISLLSALGSLMAAHGLHHQHHADRGPTHDLKVSPSAITFRGVGVKHAVQDALQATPGSPNPGNNRVTLPTATSSFPTTTTNFVNQPFSTPIPLFDPSLGTLVAVTVSHSVTLNSTILFQNLSTSGPVSIVATLNGSYEIDGLNQPIAAQKSVSQGPITDGTFNPANPSANRLPPLSLGLVDNPPATTFTNSADLNFFVASAGRTSVTPTMTANGLATSSDAGNIRWLSQTDASGSVSVAYTYIPNIPCHVNSVVRFGVHHQETVIVVTFTGNVDPAMASNPNNYSISSPRGDHIKVISATYDAANNSVALVPARRLNVHLPYDLTVVLPCPGMGSQVIPFGTKHGLGGLYDHHGRFVLVKDGHIVPPGGGL